MTKPTEPMYPSHPAHVIHHEHCGHILRRVIKPVPGDTSQTGCMCDYSPEMKWRTKRAEFNGITAEIDELTYEAKSVSLDCSYCYGVRMGHINPEAESLEESGKKKSKKRVSSKSPPKSKKPGRKPRSKQRKVASTACDSSMTSLDTESSFISETSGAAKERRRSGRGNQELVLENPDFSFDPLEYFEEGSIEDKVWKALRSRTVRR